MKAQGALEENWAEDLGIETESEEIRIAADQPGLPCAHEMTRAHEMSIDWNDVLQTIAGITHESYVKESCRTKLLAALMDERERMGVPSTGLIDQFVSRVQCDDFGCRERDGIVAKCVMIVGWSDSLVTCEVPQLKDFYSHLIDEHRAGAPVYEL